MVSFRQLIQSLVGFISALCFREKGGFIFLPLLSFLAVFRNSMNVIANVIELLGFFVIDGKEGGRYPRDTLKCKRG